MIVDLNDLFVKDSSSLYAAGNRGTILFSTDKGNTWEKQITERTENLHSIKFNNNDIGIASGDDNVFLRSSLGESTDYSTTDNISLISDSKEKEETSSSYLKDNYPNPFNPSTKISYFIPEFSKVEIKIYDIAGKLIEVLENGFKPKGLYSVNFQSSGTLPSGAYFYQLNIFDEYDSRLISTETKKMLLIK